MDILTLELFDVTISEALRELHRALEDHPFMPVRILLGHDPMLQHNIQRYLERLGRPGVLLQDGADWRIEVAGAGSGPARTPPAAQPVAAPFQPPIPAAPQAAPAAGTRPLLITRSQLGQGSQDIGRRLLLGVLRELDPAVPWLGLALDGLDLLDDPQAMVLLAGLQARGTPVRVSRESQLFPLEPGPFETMEDSHWQRLAGRGAITIL
jgi:hypothetical protein